MFHPPSPSSCASDNFWCFSISLKVAKEVEWGGQVKTQFVAFHVNNCPIEKFPSRQFKGETFKLNGYLKVSSILLLLRLLVWSGWSLRAVGFPFPYTSTFHLFSSPPFPLWAEKRVREKWWTFVLGTFFCIAPSGSWITVRCSRVHCRGPEGKCKEAKGETNAKAMTTQDIKGRSFTAPLSNANRRRSSEMRSGPELWSNPTGCNRMKERKENENCVCCLWVDEWMKREGELLTELPWMQITIALILGIPQRIVLASWSGLWVEIQTEYEGVTEGLMDVWRLWSS